MTRDVHQTPEYVEASFNPEDTGTGPLPPPSDGLLATIRATYDEARRLEARRYFGDTLVERHGA